MPTCLLSFMQCLLQANAHTVFQCCHTSLSAEHSMVCGVRGEASKSTLGPRLHHMCCMV